MIPSRIHASVLPAVACFILLGCGVALAPQKPELPLSVKWQWVRENNLFVDDRYVIRLTVFHAGEHSARGNYIVRAYGDVFGTGGVENADFGDNYDESAIDTYAPGEANALHLFYYVNDPERQGNEIPPIRIEEVADLKFDFEFIPAPDSVYRHTRQTLVIEKGKSHWVFD